MENRDFEARKRSSGALIRGFLGALGVLAVQLLPICGDWLNERSQMYGPWLSATEFCFDPGMRLTITSQT